jgi:hypothetical protein
MAPIERSLQLKIMVSADEKRMLAELADSEGVTASDLVRLFIRRSYAETIGAKKTKKR